VRKPDVLELSGFGRDILRVIGVCVLVCVCPHVCGHDKSQSQTQRARSMKVGMLSLH
jgi:hypothetical protein